MGLTSEPLLGADDVDDALPLVRHPKVGQIKVLHVLLDGHDLRTRLRILDESRDRLEVCARVGRDVVVDGDEGAVGPTHGPARGCKALKGLR